MVQGDNNQNKKRYNTSLQTNLANSYYGILGIIPSASEIEIRRAYRRLSKLYHPDTTELPELIAKSKFQKINEAYATLSKPNARWLYDLKIGYSRSHVIQTEREFKVSTKENTSTTHTYIQPSDRPLSAGEIFVILLLGLTFIGCFLLAILIGLNRGEISL